MSESPARSPDVGCRQPGPVNEDSSHIVDGVAAIRHSSLFLMAAKKSAASACTDFSHLPVASCVGRAAA